MHFARLAPGVWGLTAGDRIWLDSRLLQVERRCTLEHELEHVRRGHRGCQPPAVERDVHVAVARRLIPFPALLDGLRWARNLHELADELWVDEDTVKVRLEHLHPSERTKIVAMREEQG
ncbi:ImmA/IrrE family metallo-endopeptidase [Phycicoccus avicenniae]|uniref:ImmA/IrrE family metallo-endopeptidase n=1 Tax=Phycicoccus avicenniae TaxID=2828860 RepID=UPI003D2BE01D